MTRYFSGSFGFVFFNTLLLFWPNKWNYNKDIEGKKKGDYYLPWCLPLPARCKHPAASRAQTQALWLCTLRRQNEDCHHSLARSLIHSLTRSPKSIWLVFAWRSSLMSPTLSLLQVPGNTTNEKKDTNKELNLSSHVYVSQYTHIEMSWYVSQHVLWHLINLFFTSYPR